MYDIIKVYVSIQPRLITLKNFIQDFFIMIKAVDSNRDLLELMYRVESGDRCSLHDLLSPIYVTKPLETMEKVKAGTEFTVYAKTLTGKAATIQVTGEDTIDEVKAKIEKSYFDLLRTDLKVKSKQGQIQDFF